MPTERRTIVVSIDAAQVVNYQLPPDVLQYVQSVVATVDATAAGDVKPTLLVATGNGVVIAAEQQGEAISAGGSGVATWALRLAAKTGGGSAFTPQVEYVDNTIFTGDTLAANDYTDLTWKRQSGAVLLDYTNPKLPTVLAGGLYAFTSFTQFLDQFATWVVGKFFTVQLYPALSLGVPVGTQQSVPYVGPFGVIVPQIGVTLVCPLNAGDPMKAVAGSNQASAGLVAFASIVARLSDGFSL